MDWKIISSRRKFSLKDYLSDVTTEDEALKKFQSQGITNFPIEEVRQILDQKKPPSHQEDTQVISADSLESSTVVQTPPEEVVVPKKFKKPKFLSEE